MRELAQAKEGLPTPPPSRHPPNPRILPPITSLAKPTRRRSTMDNGAAAESLLPTSSSTAPTQPISFLPGSMFNLANSIIGAGVLTLPYALHQTGLLLGLLLLLLFATLSACSLLMLDRSCRLTSATSFASLGAAAFPSRAKAITRIIDLTQSLYVRIEAARQANNTNSN